MTSGTLLLTSDRRLGTLLSEPDMSSASSTCPAHAAASLQRCPSWYARPADPQDAHPRAHARLGDRAADPADVAWRARRESGIALSRIPAPGAERLGRQRM